MEINDLVWNIHRAALFFHIASGAVGFFCFWIILFTKKATKTHAYLGRVYFLSMIALGLTALVTGGITMAIPLVIHPEQSIEKSLGFASFLAFTGLIPVAQSIVGRQLILHKNKLSILCNPMTLGLHIIAVVFWFFLFISNINFMMGVFGVIHFLSLLILLHYFKILFQIKYRPHKISSHQHQIWHVESFMHASIAMHIGFAFYAGGGGRTLNYLSSLSAQFNYWHLLPIVVFFAKIFLVHKLKRQQIP